MTPSGDVFTKIKHLLSLICGRQSAKHSNDTDLTDIFHRKYSMLFSIRKSSRILFPYATVSFHILISRVSYVMFWLSWLYLGSVFYSVVCLYLAFVLQSVLRILFLLVLLLQMLYNVLGKMLSDSAFDHSNLSVAYQNFAVRNHLLIPTKQCFPAFWLFFFDLLL